MDLDLTIVNRGSVFVLHIENNEDSPLYSIERKTIDELPTDIYQIIEVNEKSILSGDIILENQQDTHYENPDDVIDDIVQVFVQSNIKSSQYLFSLYGLEPTLHTVIRIMESKLNVEFDHDLINSFMNISLDRNVLPMTIPDDNPWFTENTNEENNNHSGNCELVFSPHIKIYDLLLLKYISVKFDTSMTVQDLINLIKLDRDIFSPTSPILLFNGQFLMEDETLGEHNITCDDTIYMFIISFVFHDYYSLNDFSFENQSPEEIRNLCSYISDNHGNELLKNIYLSSKLEYEVGAQVKVDNYKCNKQIDSLDILYLPYSMVDTVGCEYICDLIRTGYFPAINRINIDIRDYNQVVHCLLTQIFSTLDYTVTISIDGNTISHNPQESLLPVSTFQEDTAVTKRLEEMIQSKDEITHVYKNTIILLEESNKLNEELKTQYEELVEENTRETESWKVEKENLLHTIELYKLKDKKSITYIQQIQERNESLVNDICLKEDLIINLQDTIEEKNNIISDINKKLNIYELENSQLNAKLIDLNPSKIDEKPGLFGKKKKQEELIVLKDKCLQLTSQNELLTKEKMKNDLILIQKESEISSISKKYTESDIYINQLLKQIHDYIDRISEYEQINKELRYSLESIEPEYSRLKDNYTTFQNHIYENDKDKKIAVNECNRYKNENIKQERIIEQLKKLVEDINIKYKKQSEEYRNMKKKIYINNSNSQRNEEEINEYKSIIETKDNEIIQLKEEKENIQLFLLQKENSTFVIDDDYKNCLKEKQELREKLKITTGKIEELEEDLTTITNQKMKAEEEKTQLIIQKEIFLTDSKRIKEENEKNKYEYIQLKTKYEEIEQHFKEYISSNNKPFNFTNILTEKNTNNGSESDNEDLSSSNSIYKDYYKKLYNEIEVIDPDTKPMDLEDENNRGNDKDNYIYMKKTQWSSVYSVTWNSKVFSYYATFFIENHCTLPYVTNFCLKGLKIYSVTDKSYEYLKKILNSSVFPRLFRLDLSDCTLYKEVFLDLFSFLSSSIIPSLSILAIKFKDGNENYYEPIYNSFYEKTKLYILLPSPAGNDLLYSMTSIPYQQIQKLDLTDQHIGDMGILTLFTIYISIGLPSLKQLILSKNDISYLGIYYIYKSLSIAKSQYNHPCNLVKLDLFKNHIEDKGLVILVKLLNHMLFPKIEYLLLGYNSITSSGFHYFHNVILYLNGKGFNTIKEFDLFGNEINTEVYIRFFWNLSYPNYLPNIKKIYIWGTKIGYKGCDALANSFLKGGAKFLEELYLCDADIDDQGIEAIVKAVEGGFQQEITILNHLKIIYLSHNAIGDRGAVVLLNIVQNGLLPSLQYLYIDNNPIKENIKEEFLKLRTDTLSIVI
ncbi:hypothetical protein WA158_005950 [Blastocystis sp. Blastoise]